MAKGNPLIEAYITAKEDDLERAARQWAHVLRKYYEALIAEGFKASQAMYLLEVLWERADDNNRKDKESG